MVTHQSCVIKEPLSQKRFLLYHTTPLIREEKALSLSHQFIFPILFLLMQNMNLFQVHIPFLIPLTFIVKLKADRHVDNSFIIYHLYHILLVNWKLIVTQEWFKKKPTTLIYRLSFSQTCFQVPKTPIEFVFQLTYHYYWLSVCETYHYSFFFRFPWTCGQASSRSIMILPERIMAKTLNFS